MYILLFFSKEKVLKKIILLSFVMETQDRTNLIPVQQVPPTAVMQQAGVVQRRTVNVTAARALG